VGLYAAKVDEYDDEGRRRACRYTCSLCGYTARDKYNIKIHLEGKHDLGSYTCPSCSKRLKTKQEMSRHVLTGCHPKL